MRAPKRQLANVGPIAQLRGGRLWIRLPQLLLGLYLFGASMAMMVNAGLGMMPWDVLHQGVARHIPLTFGQVVIVTSIVVLLLWYPLRQPPGLGTVLNAVVIGLVVDPVLTWLSEPGSLLGKVALMTAGLVLNAVATAMYIGAQLGPGPRDGLMTGLSKRTGRSIRLVRTLIEVVSWPSGGSSAGSSGWRLSHTHSSSAHSPNSCCPPSRSPWISHRRRLFDIVAVSVRPSRGRPS